MTVDRIPALLEPIQNRLGAESSYEWGCQIGGIIYPHTYEADARRDARFEGNSQRIAVKRIRPGKWVDADTPAPTDQARLLAAVQAVTALHKPSKRWEPYEGAGYTFLTREQALEAAGEEDLGVVAVEAGPQFFEVCAECARVESEQLSETGEEWGYREALWPCPTVAAVVAALGGEA